MHGSQQDPAHRQRFLQEGAAGKDVERDRACADRAGASATCTASPRMVPRRVGETCEQRGGFWLAGRVGRARDVRWASAAPTGSRRAARAHEGTLATCLEEAPHLRVTRADVQVAPSEFIGLRGGQRALLPNQQEGNCLASFPGSKTPRSVESPSESKEFCNILASTSEAWPC